MQRKILICSLFIFSILNSKILIFTYAYNRPDFIEIQYKTFKAFLKDDYEFIVFSDARDQGMKQQINHTCKKLGLTCIQVPQEIHDQPYLERLPGENYNHPTVRNVNVVQYSLDTLGFDHNDIVALFDSDAFLIKPFSIRSFLREYDMGGMKLGNGHVEYLWHGLAFLNMPALPNKTNLNFNCGKVDGHPIDAGGYSYYYLKNNPGVKIRYFKNYNFTRNYYCEDCKKNRRLFCSHNTPKLEAAGFLPHEIKFIQSVHNVEFFNKTFLHYRGGTNWMGKDNNYHKLKTQLLNQFINDCLSL